MKGVFNVNQCNDNTFKNIFLFFHPLCANKLSARKGLHYVHFLIRRYD